DDHIKNGDNSSDLKVKIDKFPLKCVRPFVYETISIESNVEIVDKLEEMIDSVQKCDSCPIDNFCDRCKPLIRLRIFTQEIINKLPFQNEFNNRVANPGEMLHIMKRKESKNDQMDKNSIKTDEKKKQDTIVTFQDIFLSVLKNTKLNIIPEYLTAKKVDEFIEKENKMAITEMVDEIIQYSNLQTLDENMVSKKSNIEEDKEFAQNVRTDLNKKYISYFNSITDTDFYSQAQQMGLFEEELTQSNTQIQETDKIKEIEQGFLVDESDDFSNLNQKKKLNVSGHFDKSSYKMENMAKVRKNDRDFLLDEEINDKGFLLDEEINDKGFLLDEEINDKGFLLDEEDKKKHEKKSYKWSDLI
ncbi:double strand break repair protein MRE11A isoform, partial [Pseudoloma neurophilia]